MDKNTGNYSVKCPRKSTIQGQSDQKITSIQYRSKNYNKPDKRHPSKKKEN